MIKGGPAHLKSSSAERLESEKPFSNGRNGILLSLVRNCIWYISQKSLRSGTERLEYSIVIKPAGAVTDANGPRINSLSACPGTQLSVVSSSVWTTLSYV